MVFGSLVSGKILDREYRAFKRKTSGQVGTDNKHDPEEAATKEETVPLEKVGTHNCFSAS